VFYLHQNLLTVRMALAPGEADAMLAAQQAALVEQHMAEGEAWRARPP
jgi:hypothetical protein